MMGNSLSPGLYIMTVEDIFNRKKPNQKIYVSFYEIYCSQLYDLLHERSKLVLREDGNSNINVVGLLTIEVSSPDELWQCIDKGNEQRITSTTSANYDSSRSHSILQIRIIEEQNEVGKLCFIDLAGNERGADTYDNDKQTRLDGAEINKSLLALKECIRALDQGGKHTPFRGSKLTLVLKDSFVGNCRTMMIANIAPSNSCCELTLNTLRYADRVKELSSVKPGAPVSKKDDNLSNKLMLPRLDKKTKSTNAEAQKLKQDPLPKLDKPPRPVENKPIQSVQEIGKNISLAPPVDTKGNALKNQKSDQKLPVKNIRQHSDSNQKQKRQASSSREFKKPNPNLRKNYTHEEDSAGFSDQKAVNKKKLLPIPIKPVPSSEQKPSTFLPKRPNALQFTVLNKYFKRPIDSMSKDELKELHMAIIDDMIGFEENFLVEAKTAAQTIEHCTKRQQKIVDAFEDPAHEVDPYLNETEKMLELEFQTTNALMAKLKTFKRLLYEENQFANKYICDPKDNKKGNVKVSDFEIRSHDSLLLEDD